MLGTLCRYLNKYSGLGIKTTQSQDYTLCKYFFGTQNVHALERYQQGRVSYIAGDSSVNPPAILLEAVGFTAAEGSTEVDHDLILSDLL